MSLAKSLLLFSLGCSLWSQNSLPSTPPWRNHEVQGGFLASCLAIAPVFLERDVFVTPPLRNHYFYFPLTAPFGARIRFRAILHEGNRTSSAVFWFHASISLSYSLKGVFLLDVPCQITSFVLPGLLPLEPEFASEHSPLEEPRGPGRFFGLMLGYRPRIP